MENKRHEFFKRWGRKEKYQRKDYVDSREEKHLSKREWQDLRSYAGMLGFSREKTIDILKDLLFDYIGYPRQMYVRLNLVYRRKLI